METSDFLWYCLSIYNPYSTTGNERNILQASQAFAREFLEKEILLDQCVTQYCVILTLWVITMYVVLRKYMLRIFFEILIRKVQNFKKVLMNNFLQIMKHMLQNSEKHWVIMRFVLRCDLHKHVFICDRPMIQKNMSYLYYYIYR